MLTRLVDVAVVTVGAVEVVVVEVVCDAVVVVVEGSFATLVVV